MAVKQDMGGSKVGDDEGGIASRLWIKFRKESISALYTPFVICLASGVLDSETFLHFISQDLHFLKAFAQAYELAEECADDDEDKAAIHKLKRRVLKKLKTHDTHVREWGFELPKESISCEATIKFTDFLLATASGKVEGEKCPHKIATPFEKTKLAAYALGAMAPCLRLYAFISKKIQASLGPIESDHIYKKWIDSLTSQNFEASALSVENLLDKLCICLTGEELEVIEKLYHQALKLELDFFSAQPVARQVIVLYSRVHDSFEHNLTIFSDFDMTCTSVDSSAVLAEITMIVGLKANVDGCETQHTQMSFADLRSAWEILSSQYTKEYQQCMESISSSERVEGFDYEGLCKALEQLSDFEKRANSRVIQSGVLKGLNLAELKRSGRRLYLQDGCREFFRETVKNESLKTDIHVLSYCWSGDLIRSAFSSGDMNDVHVHSNELACEESVTTGEIIRKMESAMEKLQAYTNILKGSINLGKQLTVYIGGSVGDLLCLLEADVGIVINSSSGLRRLGDQFGISFIPLFSGLLKKQRELTETGSSNWKGRSGILYTVSTWDEIHAFILGHRNLKLISESP